MSLTTVGHGTLTQQVLCDLLLAAAVTAVVDIRIAPGSRRQPHVARTALERWLPAAGIGYRWEKRLGGFRTPGPDSPDVALRNDSFRGYAGWMRGDEFRDAVDELLTSASGAAVLCSESLWWRCHRRLLADFVALARHVDVRHLFHDGRFEPHRLTDGVRLRDDGLLVYDAGWLPGCG